MSGRKKALLTGLAAAAALVAPPDANAANRARDGKIAVTEEFEAARKAGTREAFELFLARQPDSVHAAEARRLLRALETTPAQTPKP